VNDPAKRRQISDIPRFLDRHFTSSGLHEDANKLARYAGLRACCIG